VLLAGGAAKMDAEKRLGKLLSIAHPLLITEKRRVRRAAETPAGEDGAPL
jgi:hypothetical protein